MWIRFSGQKVKGQDHSRQKHNLRQHPVKLHVVLSCVQWDIKPTSFCQSIVVSALVVVMSVGVFRMNTSLLSLLTRGLQMSSDELAGIVPLVSVFSALFSHVLTLMHDVEFFEDQSPSQSRVS